MSEAKVVMFEFGPDSKALLERAIKAMESRPAAGGARSANGGATFPFGRSKGQPIAGAPVDDLKWVGERVAQSVSDPSRSQYRVQNEQLLAAINAELEKQGQPAFHAEGGPKDTDVPF